MSLLTSIFRKTTRKRSRSDADVEPSSIQAQQWGRPPAHTVPMPATSQRPVSQASIQSSSMKEAVLRSRTARLSVSVQPSDDAFDSSSTLVDPLATFTFPSRTMSEPLPSKEVVPQQGAEKACGCACTCSDFELRKLRVRGSGAKIRIGVRYGFMFTHTALTVASLIIALHRRDVIMIGMLAALTFAYLVYIPAAFALSLAKAASRFDHVAGEIAYLSVATAGYLGSGLYPAIMLSLTDCNETWDDVDWDRGQVTGGKPYTNQPWCDSLSRSASLGFAHASVLAIWLAGVLCAAIMTGLKSRGGPGVGRALQVSTGWLLSGWPISPAEKNKPR